MGLLGLGFPAYRVYAAYIGSIYRSSGAYMEP